MLYSYLKYILFEAVFWPKLSILVQKTASAVAILLVGL
jgi:hypothetical protein